MVNPQITFWTRSPAPSSETIQPAAKRRHLVAPCVSAGSGKPLELSAEGATLCDTHKGAAGPPGLDDLFFDEPRPYGTWLFNGGPSGLWLRLSLRWEICEIVKSADSRPRYRASWNDLRRLG